MKEKFELSGLCDNIYNLLQIIIKETQSVGICEVFDDLISLNLEIELNRYI